MRRPLAPRRAAASTRAASCSRRRPTRATRRCSPGPPRTDRRTPAAVEQLHLLRAPRAADARAEGLHDDALPLGVDLPRLQAARRHGRELLARRDAAQLRALARAARARERRSGASRIVRKNLYRPELVPGAPASCTAAVRSSKTSARRRPRLPSATRKPTTTTTRSSRRSPLTASSRVAPARARRRGARADERDRLRAEASAYGRSDARLRRVRSRRGAARREAPRSSATGALAIGADNVVDAACGLDPSTADIRRPRRRGTGTKSRSRRARAQRSPSRSTR